MRMTGEERIAAPRDAVWQALNDPAVLRQCIPGCQSLERDGEDRLRAEIAVKIGPIGARFAGTVTLSEIDAPNGYRISGEGQCGTVGHARGGAKVTLAADGLATRLSYAVEAEVGGRLAQLGGPIIDATAKQLAGQFFRNFNAVVSSGTVPAEDGPVAVVTAPVQAPPSTGGHPWGWIIALLLALATGVLLERSGVAGTGMVAIGLLLAVTALAGFEAGRRGRR